MTITDPYKEIHARQEKIAKMHDEFADTPSERTRHMEEVAELREENKKLRQSAVRYQERWDDYQDFCRGHGAHGITHLVVQRDKYRKALEEILKSAEYPDSPMEHKIYEIAQRALDDE